MSAEPTSTSPHTRGFLFADLRGYTRYTEDHGDRAAAELIGRYRALVRREIAAFHGAEIRTEGDSFYVVFESVSEAVQAGLAIRDAARVAAAVPGTHAIRVGIGIHAGETVDDADDGIVSSAVNIAARVCAVADADEVLVTETVRGLTRTALPVRFVPRGRRRLKGIAEPIALFRAEPIGAPAPVRRRRGMPVAVGAAVIVAVVVVAVLVASRAGSGTATLPTQSADTSVAASESAEPDRTPDLSRFGPGEYPNTAETELLGLLLERVADSCDRADPEDGPVFRMVQDDAGVRRPRPLRVRAGVTCLTDGTRVLYWQGSDTSSNLGLAYAYFFDVTARLSIAEGDCATESRVRGTWQAGVHSGQVLCYVSADGEAVIEWTFDDANIYAIARRRDAQTRELYEWWSETGVRFGR